MEPTDETFGQALRRLRQAAGKPMSLLAKPHGWSLSYVQNIEMGSRHAPADAVIVEWLGLLGAEAELPRMRRLAAVGRRCIEFPLPPDRPRVAEALLAFKRRAEEGTLDDATLDRLLGVLDRAA